MSAVFEKHGLAKARFRSVSGEFKACIWGFWSWNGNPSLCAASYVLGKWMKGWRKTRKSEALSFCSARVWRGEERKGARREHRISINSVSFIECRGHSLVWGNVVLLDYNIWLACRAGTDRTATAMNILLPGWKGVMCFDIMTFLLYCHTWVRICDFLIPPTW